MASSSKSVGSAEDKDYEDRKRQLLKDTASALKKQKNEIEEQALVNVKTFGMITLYVGQKPTQCQEMQYSCGVLVVVGVLNAEDESEKTSRRWVPPASATALVQPLHRNTVRIISAPFG